MRRDDPRRLVHIFPVVLCVCWVVEELQSDDESMDEFGAS